MLIVFKIVFGFLGLKAAMFMGQNPLAGVVIGVITGHIVDYAASVRLARFRYERTFKRQAKVEFENRFLSSLFLMLGHICASDGVISKEEIKEVERVMDDVLKLKRPGKKRAVNIFRSVRTTTTPFQSNAVGYFELYQNHPEMLESTIGLFFKVAAADGPLNEAEERAIHTAAMVFGLSEQRYEQMKAPYVHSKGETRDVAECYAVLGCSENDSVEQIKRSYRKLVSQYHPDKIISKELPEDFIQFANHKFKSIQSAFEEVKALRGIK